MKQLIAISQKKIDKQHVETVNARDLHAFLESKQRFADWIKSRIHQYGFIEDEDFTVHKFMIGKATQIDYYLTLDMAKELSMVERNAKGKQARRYFIQCEKIAKSKPTGWQKVRSEGKAARNSFTDTLRDHGCSKPYHYMNCTKAVSKAITGKTPAEIKKQRNLANGRDGLTKAELAGIQLAEILAEQSIEETGATGFQECFLQTKVTSKAIALALETQRMVIATAKAGAS